MTWDRSTIDGAAAEDVRRACANALGHFVGDWRLDALIGLGRHTAVYAASHQDTLDSAAITLLRPDLEEKDAATQQLVHEAEQAALLTHPGTLNVLDTGVGELGAFMVTELLLGHPVSALPRLRGGPLGAEELTRLGIRTLEVLSHAHRRGIVHGHLRPESLFLTEEEQLKVLDFGQPSVPSQPTLAGHPSFTAPEQRAEQILGEARTDVWQLGVTLFWLATVTPQAEGEGYTRTRPQLPVSLMSLLNKAQAQSPADRFQGAESMRHALMDVRLQLNLSDLAPQVISEPSEALPDEPTVINGPIQFSSEDTSPPADAQPERSSSSIESEDEAYVSETPSDTAAPDTTAPDTSTLSTAVSNSAIPSRHDPPPLVEELPLVTPSDEALASDHAALLATESLNEPLNLAVVETPPPETEDEALGTIPKRITSDEEIIEALFTLPPQAEATDVSDASRAEMPFEPAVEAPESPAPLLRQLTPAELSMANLGLKPSPFSERPELTLYPEEQTSSTIQDLATFFEHLEEALTMWLVKGAEDDETGQHLYTLSEHLATALNAHPEGMLWTIEPFGFIAGEHVLWRPEGTLVEIPRALHNAGGRRMAVLHGVDRGQIEALVEALAHPLGERRGDPLCVLWAADPEHIVLEADPFSSDAGIPQQELMLQACLDVLTTQCIPHRPGLSDAWHPSAEQTGTTERHGVQLVQALHIDPPRVEAFMQQLAALEPPTAQLDALISGAFVEMRALGDESTLLKSLRRSVSILILQDPEDITALLSRLLLHFEEEPERQRELINGVLSADSVTLWARWLLDRHAEHGLPEHTETLLLALGPEHLTPLVPHLHQLSETSLQRAVFQWLEQVSPGQESLLGQLLPAADAALGLALVETLGRRETEAGRQAMMSASSNRHSVVRLEALGFLNAGESGPRVEIRPLLEDPDPQIRLAALKIMARHRIRHAGPSLVMRIRTPEFDELPVEERRQCLETLHALDPGRTESLALDLLRSRRFLSSDAHEQSRELAAELLGQISRDAETVKYLREEGQARWKNSHRVRQAAQIAIQRIERRLIGRQDGAL